MTDTKLSGIARPHHTPDKYTTDSWITPKKLIDMLGPFDLDPCACDPQPWPCAKRQYTEHDNGLLMPWSGLVWMNPPYGHQLGAWPNRLALHNNGLALVFARTDTRAFFDNVWPFAESLLFVKGRVTFVRPDGRPSPAGHNSGGPSVLIAYGKKADARLRNAGTPPSSLGHYLHNGGRASEPTPRQLLGRNSLQMIEGDQE